MLLSITWLFNYQQHSAFCGSIVATKPTLNAIIADLLFGVYGQLFFHGSQLFIFDVDEYTVFKMGVSKVPRILYAGLRPVLVYAAHVFFYSFTHEAILYITALR